MFKYIVICYEKKNNDVSYEIFDIKENALKCVSENYLFDKLYNEEKNSIYFIIEVDLIKNCKKII